MKQLSLFDITPFEEELCQTTILLSLKNEYFLKMIKGTKKYEYRFTFPKTPVKAYIYAPKKIKSIIGYIELAKPIEGNADEISSLYANCGDGDYDVMHEYIGNHKKIYAMKVLKVAKFDNPIPYKEIKNKFPNFYAPQSYLILDKKPELLRYIQSFANRKSVGMTNKLSNVHYPVGGVAQYYDSPLDLLACDITSEINKIVINTSVQPNSIPHFGTMTTLMGAFILAKRAQDRFAIPSAVEIDFVDCGPTAKYHQNGGKICKSISNTPSSEDPSKSIAEYYIDKYYSPLLTWIRESSQVPFTIRRYKKFQSIEIIRKASVEICRNEKIAKLLNPNTNKIHIRSECPVCKNIDKQMENTIISSVLSDSFVINSFCPEHGKYETIISTSNDQYFEANTQLRDITKGVLMSEYKKKQILGVMYDGGDWGGTWTHHVHCKVLCELGYNIPLRLFAPLILDWSGGKLSKSIYRSDSSHSVDGLENYECFIDTFGNKGLEVIYNEVDNWLSSSKKFFRDYSLEYILEVLKQTGDE